jgi:hypothetical protein
MNATPVRVVETGRVYPSLTAAVTAVTGREPHGRDRDNYHMGRPICGVLIAPADDPFWQPDSDFRSRKSRPTRCVETGELFPSISAAARAMNVAPAVVHRAINTRRPCCGYHWTYADD